MQAYIPLISIVIPVYNGTNYMRMAIDSALAQTYPNKEIIVINDGSRDNGKTLEVARSYGDRIRLIDKPNGGVATALNAGIKAMNGEFLSWLSHDDVYPADKLEKQVSVLQNLADKNTVLFGDYKLIDNAGNEMGRVNASSIDTANILFELYARQTMHGCTLLVPKAVFDQVGMFKENLPTTQDYDLWIRTALKFPFLYVPEVLAYSRQHEEQGSRTMMHRQEVAEFYVGNFAHFTPQWLDAHYPSDVARDKYMLLLKKFAAERMWAAFGRVYMQAVSHLRFKNLHDHVCFRLTILGYICKQSLSGAAKNMVPLFIKNLVRKNLNRQPSPGATAEPSNLDFINIYRKNIFGSKESRSGSGSTLEQTAHIREVLPNLFKDLGIKSILDVPCGDFNWMKLVEMPGVHYTGGDIVPEIVAKNMELYATPERDFKVINIIEDELPKVDLIFCRDCLVHMKFEHAQQAIQNFKNSGSTYLLATTFTDRPENEELYGIWRTLNLQKAPFNLPEPVQLINEKCTEGRMKYTDKSLGLWRLQDI